MRYRIGALCNMPPNGLTFGVLSMHFAAGDNAAATNLAAVPGPTTFTAWLGGTKVSEFVSSGIILAAGAGVAGTLSRRRRSR